MDDACALGDSLAPLRRSYPGAAAGVEYTMPGRPARSPGHPGAAAGVVFVALLANVSAEDPEAARLVLKLSEGDPIASTVAVVS